MGRAGIEKAGPMGVLQLDPEDVPSPNAGPNDCIFTVGVSQSDILPETDVEDDNLTDTGLDLE